MSESESDESSADFARLTDMLQARGLPSHIVNAFGSKVQQFLHRTMSTGLTSRSQQLINTLQQSDESLKLTALSELCQLLVISNEDTLVGFPIKQAVPLLLQCLSNQTENFELMNHACRALTYMMESLPRSSSLIAEQGIPILLEKLQVIQCMDVAEQALTALEIVSRRNSKQILHANGISAVLTYVDFFSIGAQRNALQVAANCCHSLVKEEFSHVHESLACLAQRLTHSDKKSVEAVCTIFARLVDNFQRDSVIIGEIAAQQVLPNMRQLLVVKPQIISSATFVSVLHTMNLMCIACTDLAVDLVAANVHETLKYLLMGNGGSCTSTPNSAIQLSTSPNVSIGSEGIVCRPPQELYEIVSLIGEMMPRLPRSHIDELLKKASASSTGSTSTAVMWQWKDERDIWRPYTIVDSRIIEAAYSQKEDEVQLTAMGRQYVIDFNAMLQINEESGTARAIFRKVLQPNRPGSNESESAPSSESRDRRLDALNNDKEPYERFVRALFVTLYDVFSSSAGAAIKHRCMRALLRMIYYVDASVLHDLLQNLAISSHIASMLAAAHDLKIVVAALQMCDMLMSKLPHIFAVYFHREGVIHQIDRLIETYSVPATSDTSEPEPPKTQLKSESKLMESLRRKVRAPKRSTRKSAKNGDNEPSEAMETAFSQPAPIPIPTPQQAASSSTSADDKFLSLFDHAYWGQLSSKSTQNARRAPKTEPNNREMVRAWIHKTAKSFKEKYFSEQSEEASEVTRRRTESESQGKAIFDRLHSAVQRLSGADSASALREIAAVIIDTDISPFEMIHSGLIASLLEYLSAGRPAHLVAFLEVFAPVEMASGSTSVLFASLMSKLNACVNQLEQFSVKINEVPGSQGYGRTAIKFFHTHQLKCALERDPTCSALIRQWKSGPVKVDPLAAVSAIEKYLVLRGINKTPSSTSESTSAATSDPTLESRDHDDDEESDNSDEDDEDDDDDDIEDAISVILGRTSETTGPRLELMLNGNVLPSNMTIYQAIKQFSGAVDTDTDALDSDSFMSSEMWSKVHTLVYRVVAAGSPNAVATTVENAAVVEKKEKKATVSFTGNYDYFIAGLNNDWMSTATISDASLSALTLLRLLNALNRNWYLLYPHLSAHQGSFLISPAEFVNMKLTAKARRQLQDPLVVMTGALPKWLPELVRSCAFLVPFETRLLFFYILSMDRDRAMQKLLDFNAEIGNNFNDSKSTTERIVPKLERKKKTIVRGDDLMKQCEAVLSEFATNKSKALLEIQYENEVGTGLGPTLEFYALMSLEMQKAEHEMWRGDKVKIKTASGANKDALFFHAPNGLFPAPLPRNAKATHVARVRQKFKLLGRFVAKAIMDFRVLDLQLSIAFFKWLVDERSISESDLKHVDATLYRSMESLREYLRQRDSLMEKKRSGVDVEVEMRALEKSVLDLDLDFTLPGFEGFELKKGGKNTPVSLANLDEYLRLVSEWTLIEGVHRQIDAFKEGFGSIMPVASLQQFYPEELERLFCGSGYDLWDSKLLMECTRCDHGYTHDSKAVQYLFEIMCAFNADEQRLFLQFITGSPRLPIGGLFWVFFGWVFF